METLVQIAHALYNYVDTLQKIEKESNELKEN